MPFWKKATQKVTEHAMETAKGNLSETIIKFAPVAVLIFGFVMSLTGNKTANPTQPIVININLNHKEDI